MTDNAQAIYWPMVLSEHGKVVLVWHSSGIFYRDCASAHEVAPAEAVMIYRRVMEELRRE